MPCPRQLESKLATVGLGYGLLGSSLLVRSTTHQKLRTPHVSASCWITGSTRLHCIALHACTVHHCTCPALWAASRRRQPGRRAKARLAARLRCAPDTIQTAVEPDAAVRTRAALTRLICQFDRASPRRAGREAVRAGGSQLAGGIGLDGDGIKMRDGRMPVLAFTRASSLRRPRGWPAGSVSPSDWGICFRLPLLATRRDADARRDHKTFLLVLGWGSREIAIGVRSDSPGRRRVACK